ncbi:MAG TPA: hypothetical protein VFY65_13165 [Longimicrobium sp.]|nr:hypothetical protein [Longimicrobium sp.]
MNLSVGTAAHRRRSTSSGRMLWTKATSGAHASAANRAWSIPISAIPKCGAPAGAGEGASARIASRCSSATSWPRAASAGMTAAR